MFISLRNVTRSSVLAKYRDPQLQTINEKKNAINQVHMYLVEGD